MSIWVVPIVIVILTAIPLMYSLYVRRRIISVDALDTSNAEYKIHWVVKLFILAEICMSLWIMTFYRKGDIGSILFFGGIGLLLLALGLMGLYVCNKAKVKFQGDRLFYCNGFKTSIIDSKNVRNVWAANGFIVIDLGSIPRTGFMHIFSKSYEILAKLQSSSLLENQRQAPIGGRQSR